jgi:hypothetical protein
MPIDFDDLRGSKTAIKKAARSPGGKAVYDVFRSSDRRSDLRIDVYATFLDKRRDSGDPSIKCDLKIYEGGFLLSNTTERDCWCKVRIEITGDGAEHFAITGSKEQPYYLRKCRKREGDFAGMDPDTGDRPVHFRLQQRKKNPPPRNRLYLLGIRIVGEAIADDQSWPPCKIDTLIQARVELR